MVSMTMTRVGHATGMRWWGCGVVWCGDFLLWRLPYAPECGAAYCTDSSGLQIDPMVGRYASSDEAQVWSDMRDQRVACHNSDGDDERELWRCGRSVRLA